MYWADPYTNALTVAMITDNQISIQMLQVNLFCFVLFIKTGLNLVLALGGRVQTKCGSQLATVVQYLI